ncbi:nuclear transport factor 2 family protein [bacterium]|nr:nuclear transport factor 2 family protein [bacterium]
MFLDLPEPVAAYFAADHASADCFHKHGVVRDEGSTYQGRPAVRQWREATARKYNYTNQPLAVERHDEKWVVTSRVTGNFPGSPVELQYSFKLADHQIVELEIS